MVIEHYGILVAATGGTQNENVEKAFKKGVCEIQNSMDSRESFLQYQNL